MKVLIAGNPEYGLAQALSQKFNAEFASRSHGNWDLSNSEKQKEFAQKSLNYDVVISVSCLWGFNQTNLVQEVATSWMKNKKAGHLIALGSSADTPVKGTTWVYPAEKKALRAYCRQVSQMVSSNDDVKFKMTYLSPGNMHTPKQDEKIPDAPKLECHDVVSVIEWLLTQPQYVNISELCLDRIPNISKS
jgi:short-subunit dehydrogenase